MLDSGKLPHNQMNTTLVYRNRYLLFIVAITINNKIQHLLLTSKCRGIWGAFCKFIILRKFYHFFDYLKWFYITSSGVSWLFDITNSPNPGYLI